MPNRMFRFVVGVVLFITLVGIPSLTIGQPDPNTITVISWNVESGGADPNVIARLKEQYQEEH